MKQKLVDVRSDMFSFISATYMLNFEFFSMFFAKVYKLPTCMNQRLYQNFFIILHDVKYLIWLYS